MASFPQKNGMASFPQKNGMASFLKKDKIDILNYL